MSGFEENSTEEVCRVWVEVASGVSLEDQFPELNQSKPSNGRKNRNTQEVSPLTEFVLATCSEAQYKDAQKRRLAEKSPSAVAATEIAASAGNVGPSQKIERNIRPKARAGAIAATNSSPLADPGDRIPVKITFSQTGTEINAPVSKLFMENPENMLKESHDLTSLAFLEEANVLAALKVRFTNEYVYTSIAGVIIAINPCKKTPIYSFEVMKSFRNTSNLNSLGSHIYKAAEEAYRNLTMKFNFKYKKAPTNQSMVICGESGSGKTESSKHIMRYLTNRSNDLEESQLPQSNENQISIEQQIMQTNFILEVIGNAKTKLNHNSSRFGKFTKVYFNTANLDPNYDGKNPPPNTNNVVGAATNTYLLEKSRVVIQSPGERNYHIFYGLVSAARQQLSFDIDQFNAEHLGIVGMDIKDFSYLAASSSDFEESKKDAGGYNSIERFEEMVKAFKSINLPEKEQRGIMEIIAGILHLGNIELQDGVGDQAFVTEKSHRHLEHAARLLSIKQDDLTNRITTQTIRVRGEIVIKKLRKVDAIVARDAISKTIYETLFLFLVGRVNNSLMQRTGDSQNSSLPWIGILDVFGFEVFENNSFEQFCINFANEQLQQHFNRAVLLTEQLEYSREGLMWKPINLPDSSDTIELISNRTNGIFAILDSACRMQSSTPQAFLDNLFEVHPNDFKLTRLKGALKSKSKNIGEGFILRHYADSVIYNADEFLLKNRDRDDPEVTELMVNSTGLSKACFEFRIAERKRELEALESHPSEPVNLPEKPMVKKPTPSLKPPPAAKHSGGFMTVAKGFSAELKNLITTLSETQSYFVRCVKPNLSFTPFEFDSFHIRPQLRCGGVVEAVKMLKVGYPIRVAYDDIFDQFQSLLPSSTDKQKTWLETISRRDLTRAILEMFGIRNFQLAIHKVFFRAELASEVNQVIVYNKMITNEQFKLMMQFINRIKFKRVCRAVLTGLSWWETVRKKRSVKLFRRGVLCGNAVLKSFPRLLKAIRTQKAIEAELERVRLLEEERLRKLEEERERQIEEEARRQRLLEEERQRKLEEEERQRKIEEEEKQRKLEEDLAKQEEAARLETNASEISPADGDTSQEFVTVDKNLDEKKTLLANVEIQLKQAVEEENHEKVRELQEMLDEVKSQIVESEKKRSSISKAYQNSENEKIKQLEEEKERLRVLEEQKTKELEEEHRRFQAEEEEMRKRAEAMASAQKELEERLAEANKRLEELMNQNKGTKAFLLSDTVDDVEPRAMDYRRGRGTTISQPEVDISERRNSQTTIASSATLLSSIVSGANLTPAELEKAALEMNKILKNKQAARRVGNQTDSIKMLLESIRSQPRIIRLVEHSVDSLTSIVTNDPKSMDLTESSIVEVLFNVMKVNPYNENIQRVVSRCFEAMAENLVLVARIEELGLINQFVSSLNRHCEKQTHLQTCSLLSSLMRNQNVALRFVENGGISALSKVIDDHEDDNEIVLATLQVMNVAALSTRSWEAIKGDGIHERLTEMLRLHSESPTATLESLTLISSLMNDDKTGNILSILRATDALSAVVEVMENNPTDQKVLDLSVQILEEIVSDDEVEKNLSFVKSIEKSLKGDRVQLLEAAADKHMSLPTPEPLLQVEEENIENVQNDIPANNISESDLSLLNSKNVSKARPPGLPELEKQENSLIKIVNLSLIPSVADFLISKNALPLLVSIMANNIDLSEEINSQLVETSCRGIVRLCQYNSRLIEEFIKIGGEVILRQCFKNFMADPIICIESAKLLQMVMVDQLRAARVVAADVVPAFLEAVEMHYANSQIVKAVTDVFLEIATAPEAKKFFLESGGYQRILEIMQMHLDDGELALVCLDALAAFTEKPEQVKYLRIHQGFYTVLDLLRMHVDEPDVAAASLDFFQLSMEIDPRFVFDMIGLGIIDIVRQVMSTHPDNVVLRNYCTKLVTEMGLHADVAGIGLKIGAMLQKHENLTSDEVLDNPQVLEDLLTYSRVMREFLNPPPGASIQLDELLCIPAAIQAFKLSLTLPPTVDRAEILENSVFALFKAIFANPEKGTKVAMVHMKSADLQRLCEYLMDKFNSQVTLVEQFMILVGLMCAYPEFAYEVASSDLPVMLIEMGNSFHLTDRVLAELVVIIFRIVTEREELIPTILSAHAQNLVIESIYAEIQHSGRLFNALNLMVTLAIDSKSVDALISAGILNAVARVIRQHHHDPDLQSLCMDILLVASNHPKTLDFIHEQHWISLFIRFLSTFKYHEELVMIAVQLLDRCAHKKNFLDELVSIENSVDIIGEAIDNHPDAQIQLMGLRLVDHIINNFVIDDADEARVAAAIAAAKEQQEQAMAAQSIIEQISSNATNGAAASKIIVEGGFDVLLDLLKANAVNLDVCKQILIVFITILDKVGEDLIDLAEFKPVVLQLLNLLLAIGAIKTLNPQELVVFLRQVKTLSASLSLRAKCVEMGMIPFLVQIWELGRTDSIIAIALMGALSNFTKEPQLHEVYSQQRTKGATIHGLLELVKALVENSEFVLDSIMMATHLSASKVLRTLLLKNMAIETFYSILKRWMHDLPIVQAIVKFYVTISVNNPMVSELIVDIGVMHTLLSINGPMLNKLSLLKSITTLISNVCYDNTQIMDVVGNAGASRFLVDSILRFCDSESLLLIAFRAIGNLSYYHPNVPLIVYDGAIQALVVGMTLHMDNPEIVDICLGVLSNLAVDMIPEIKLAMSQDGAVETVLDIMAGNVTDSKIVNTALVCLYNLLSDEKNIRSADRQNVVSIVANVLRIHPENNQTVLTCTALIAKVIVQDKISRPSRKAKEVYDIILQSLIDEGWDRSPGIACNMLRVVQRLCKESDAADILIVDALLGHLSQKLSVRKLNLVTRRELMFAMSVMASRKKAAVYFAKSNLEVIFEIAQAHFNNKLLLEASLTLLAAISNFDIAVKPMLKRNLTTSLVGIMAAKHDNKKHVMLGLRIIENMSYGDETARHRFKQDGATFSVEQIRKLHHGDSEIVYQCEITLDALRGLRRRGDKDNIYVGIRSKLEDDQKLSNDLTEDFRDMLFIGCVVKQHFSTGKPERKHIWVSNDLTTLNWKDSRRSELDADNFRLGQVRVINKGRCTPQLCRRSFLLRNYLAKEECSMGLYCKGKNLSIEFATMEERDAWFKALKVLQAKNSHELKQEMDLVNTLAETKLALLRRQSSNNLLRQNSRDLRRKNSRELRKSASFRM